MSFLIFCFIYFPFTPFFHILHITNLSGKYLGSSFKICLKCDHFLPVSWLSLCSKHYYYALLIITIKHLICINISTLSRTSNLWHNQRDPIIELHTVFLLTQATSQLRTWSGGPLLMGFTSLTWNSCPDRVVEQPLKDTTKEWIGCHSLEGWGRVLLYFASVSN